ncbi:MAG: transposase, partial [Solobacterium sp.]|nr:transposase [Solobacterium sp.]
MQQALPLEIVIDLSREIPENHIARTVFRAVEESGAIRFVNCRGRDEHGFKGIDMLKAVILAFAMLGSPSVRDLADLVKSDIAFRLIFPDKTPGFMAFQRFIHDDLKASVEEVFTAVNLYMKHVLPDDIDLENESIDGTKIEANANKMSFVWRKATDKYNKDCIVKICKTLEQVIRYFGSEGYKEHRLSICRKIDMPYLFE